MSEELKTQTEPKNTVATVGMWFSIIWLVALITVFFAWLWFPMLFVWFILWIIGLFYKPRGKARIAVCIPLVVFIIMVSIACYIWNSVKTPAKEWVNSTSAQLEQIDTENFDEDRFENILQSELNTLVNEKSEDEWKSMFKASTGSNSIEKASYLFFSVLQQWFENALKKYEDWDLPKIDTDDNIVDVDIDVNDTDDMDDTDDDINTTQWSNEVFTQSEKNDIQQILNILE